MRSITIVGGGLAGLTLGIALRDRGVPVELFEAGHYPRHRVCGEFISGRGTLVLERLGLFAAVRNGGGCFAETAQFFSKRRNSPVLHLPDRAWCTSRLILDALLADEFKRRGGHLYEGERWRGNWTDPGIVRATGRHLEPVVDGWRYFGLKIHARNVELLADLELHFFDNGYVGVCRIDEKTVNVSGIFRSHHPERGLAEHWQDWLMGPENSCLRERLAGAEFVDHSFSSVAGITLHPRKAADLEEFAIGDAISMTPPFTGNGMSMAFESAELTIDPCVKYSQGEIQWKEARTRAGLACDARFGRRLKWADRLQRGLFRPRIQAPIIWLVSQFPFIWRTMFFVTR